MTLGILLVILVILGYVGMFLNFKEGLKRKDDWY